MRLEIDFQIKYIYITIGVIFWNNNEDKNSSCCQFKENWLFSLTNQGFSNNSDLQIKSLTGEKVTSIKNEQIRETEATMNFGDTGQLVSTMETTTAQEMMTDRSEIDVFHQLDSGSIEQFLGRPRLISQGILQAGDGPNTFAPIDIMAAIFSEFGPKLLGHFAAKFDVKLTVECSADKFHAGRYILAYLPQFSPLVTAAPATTWGITHASTLVQVTQLQHVEIDVACDKAATLVVPWRYINEYIPLDSTSSDKYGYALFRPYAPLALGTTGSSTATYNIWLSLENIKFMGVANYQSGLGDAELKSVGKGPISAPLNTVARSLGMLGSLPLVGGYASSASWFVDALSKSAKHFGMSAPRIQSGVMPMVNMPGAYGNVSDVPRPVQILAAKVNNGVSTNPSLTGSKIDEMSIDYLKQIFAYRATYSWTTSTPVNTNLMSIYVNPITPDNFFISAGGTTEVRNHGPMGYIASRFTHWRGSIRYKFKLVKNNFHTGKLLISWVPYDGTNTVGPVIGTIDDTYYTYRQIVDVSEMNEFEVHVPFLSTKLFKNVIPAANVTSYGATYGTNFNGNVTDWTNGLLTVAVLDVLRAPDAAPASVSILMESAAGPDFQFMTPFSERYVDNTNSLNGPVPYYAGVFQSGMEDPCAINVFKFGGVEPFSYDSAVRVHEIVGGEKIDNLRVLMKRYTNIHLSASSNNSLIARPCTGKSFYQTAAGTVSGGGVYFSKDDIRFFGPMFGFFRGSMRYKFFLPATSPNNAAVARNQLLGYLIRNSNLYSSSSAQANVAVSLAGTGSFTDESAGAATVVASLSESLEIAIPFYSTDKHWSCEWMYLDDNAISAGSGSLVPTGFPAVAAYLSVFTPTTALLSKQVDRSIGEDASFSYFISCPPFIDDRYGLVP
jgi:hypothetical protein